ncbi:MAG TPA: DUF6491 family protein [Gammaproteobacteria bacterium]
MKVFKVLGCTALTFVLSSCATGPDVPGMSEMLRESTGQNGRACVRLSDIRGYGVLENDVVSIDGRTEYYLATVLPGCTDLQTSVRTLFRGDFGEVCGQTMDSLSTRGDTCTINQMFEFDNREEAFATFNDILDRRKEMKRLASEQRGVVKSDY